MPSRDWQLRVRDILTSVARIQQLTAGMTKQLNNARASQISARRLKLQN